MRQTLSIIMLALFSAFSAVAQTADQPFDAESSKETTTPEELKNYLFGWTDSKGVLHITDSIGKVPKQYRSSVRRLEYAPGQSVPQGTQPEYFPPTRDDSARKEHWQERIRDAKRRIAEGETRYRALEAKRDELLGSWGGVSSGHFEGRVEAEQVEQQMKQLQKDIDAARNDLENRIPEEARKAGVPPGWLRVE